MMNIIKTVKWRTCHLKMLLFLLVSFLCTVKGQATGAVRLYNHGDTSIENREGIVEIFHNGQWKFICDKDADYGNIPDVVCHQLGYTGGKASQSLYGYHSDSEIGFHDMSCKKDYLVILQCTSKTGVLPSDCNNNNIVAVQCYFTRIWDRAPYSGMVRLVGGSYTGEGIVEVYCHGKWGIVCSSDSTDSFPLTVCNQLGYNSVKKSGYDTEFSNTFFASMQTTDCGGSDFKKCVSDCASCNDNIDSCDRGILNVTCGHEIDTSKHGNKMGACIPKSMNPDPVAVTALVLILILYPFFIIYVCIKIKNFCCCRKRKKIEQPLLENVNDENNNNN